MRGPRSGTAASCPRVCWCWAGASSSCATDAGAMAWGGGQARAWGLRLPMPGGDGAAGEAVGGGRAGHGEGLQWGSAVAPRPHGGVWGGRLGQRYGGDAAGQGHRPLPGDACPSLGRAAGSAHNNSHVLLLQLLGAALLWDPPAPRSGGPGASSGSHPLPSQPNAAARGSIRVSWGICWQLAAFITHGDAICGEGTEPG